MKKILIVLTLFVSIAATAPVTEAASLNEIRHTLDKIQAKLTALVGLEGKVLGVSTDANGYTEFTASPDTRKIYVSSSEGNDANDGLSPAAPKRTIAAAKPLMRRGYPDWMLLKRGDVWNEGLESMSWRAGRSASEMALVSAYGNGPRPKIELEGGGTYFFRTKPDDSNTPQYLAIVGIEFSNYRRDPDHSNYSPGARSTISVLSGFDTLLFEDNLFRYVDINFQAKDRQGRESTDLTFRKNIVLENYSTSGHAQGIFTSKIKNLTIEHNVFDTNGWHPDIPAAESTVFNRTAYLSQGDGNTVYSNNIDANGASGGVQSRTGGPIENNLFLNTPIAITVGHTENPNQTVPATVRNNVILGTRDIDTQAQGTGIELITAGRVTKFETGTSYLKDVTVSRNIIANSTEGTGYGTGIGINGSGELINVDISENIVYDWRPKEWRTPDDRRASGLKINLTSSSHTNSNISNNTIQQPNGGYIAISNRIFNVPGLTMSGNRYWSSEDIDSGIWSHGWFGEHKSSTRSLNQWRNAITGDTSTDFTRVNFPDPDRDIESYMNHIGIGGGYDEFMRRARLQSKQTYDPRFTANAVNEYIRAGFGLAADTTPVPVPDPTPAPTPEPEPEPTPAPDQTPEPEPTPEPPIEEEVVNSITSRYEVGSRIKARERINVREPYGLSGEILGFQRVGEAGTVLDVPPQSADGFTWIAVDFDTGVDGWVADSLLSRATNRASVAPVETPTSVEDDNSEGEIDDGVPVTDTDPKIKTRTVKNKGSDFTNKTHRLSLAGERSDLTMFRSRQERDLKEEPRYRYPLGLYEFDIEVEPGGTEFVTLELDRVYDTSAWVYRKFINDDYIDITDQVTFDSANGVTVISYPVTDNGPLDADPRSGYITDPAGPAVLEEGEEQSETEIESESSNNSSNNSSGSGGSSKRDDDNDDEDSDNSPVVVTSASSDGLTLDSNISFRQPEFNDSDTVRSLEQFLNDFEGESLTVDGIYDSDDNEAVKRFQRKYRREILDVWDLDEATGYVGITTRLKVNFLLKGQTAVCPVFTEFNGGLSGIMASAEIGKTQEILRDLDMYSGSINNTWDAATNQALITFQETFREVMLDPWNITEGTGYKYKTTNKFLNYMAGCDTGAVELEGVGTYEGI